MEAIETGRPVSRNASRAQGKKIIFLPSPRLGWVNRLLADKNTLLRIDLFGMAEQENTSVTTKKVRNPDTTVAGCGVNQTLHDMFPRVSPKAANLAAVTATYVVKRIDDLLATKIRGCKDLAGKHVNDRRILRVLCTDPETKDMMAYLGFHDTMSPTRTVLHMYSKMKTKSSKKRT